MTLAMKEGGAASSIPRRPAPRVPYSNRTWDMRDEASSFRDSWGIRKVNAP
jgi:hypothetical protein